ncbi:hypothetical protein LSTR_LSTR009272 [Laodelphax striatellus]|uniref:Thioredoxin domain-containing protein n=1 Tax=Laodelphax striatellus TaxID=195883 RepID=A0A482X4S6_LAOST|nr:hypothetical protein LSTR_LSTR009272 [Laodelphax striatellus]
MFKAGVFLASIILHIAAGAGPPKEIKSGFVKNVSNFEEFMAESNGKSKSFLLVNCLSSVNCSGVEEQFKTICSEKKEYACFSSILPDKLAVEKSFKNLTVEWTPYLVYFNGGQEVCAFERECTLGDNNYISNGIQAAMNCSTLGVEKGKGAPKPK